MKPSNADATGERDFHIGRGLQTPRGGGRVIIEDLTGATQVKPAAIVRFGDGFTLTDLGDEVALITVGSGGDPGGGGGSGTGGVAGTGDITVLTANLTNPPTPSELSDLLGDPSSGPGQEYIVQDSSTGLRYDIISDGATFQVIPTVGNSGPATADETVTAAPLGGWTQAVQTAVENPNDSDYIVFGYVNGSTGASTVAAYRKSTDTVSGTFALRTFTPDTHTAPALLIRSSDHKLVVAYSDHSGTQLYARVSTNSLDSDPTLSGGFAAEQTLDATVGGALYTYPHLIELNDGIYLFFRDEQNGAADGVLSYTKSTNGGTTWSAKVDIWKIATKLCYWNITGSGTRFDVVITDGSPPAAETPVAVYHFYNDGSYRTSTGAAISASLPFDNTAATLIDSGATGDIWPSDIALTSDGRPVAALMRKTGAADNDWVYAEWTGSSWSVNTITNSNGVTEGSFATGPALDHENPARIIYQRKVGSHWELFTATTPDAGVSWVTDTITSGSAVDYITPRCILDHSADDLWALALVGTYTTYLSNSLGIVAVGPAGDVSAVQLTRNITMRDTKANITAFTGALEEVSFAYATDTSELGVRTNGAWVWISGGAAALDDLTDVTITTPAADQQLQYVGGVWVNNARRWEPVTHNPGGGPELVWTGDDIVMTWRTY